LTKAESHFADVRVFEEEDAPKETMPSTITSMGKGGHKKCSSSAKRRHSQTTT